MILDGTAIEIENREFRQPQTVLGASLRKAEGEMGDYLLMTLRIRDLAVHRVFCSLHSPHKS